MISVNVQIKDHINIYLTKQSFTEINVESTLSKGKIKDNREENMPRYVNADKLILIMRKRVGSILKHNRYATTCWSIVCEAFIDEIEDLLVNDKDEIAPVVHAHWVGIHGTFIPIDEYGAPIESAFCSHCNKMLVGSDEYFAIGQYCPNCGAKMDEEDTEDE